jgi:hypothetical protein
MGNLPRLDILTLQERASQGALTNLTTADCLARFDGVFESDFKAVLFVTTINSPTTSLLQTAVPRYSVSQPQSATSLVASQGLDKRAVSFCLAQPAADQVCRVSLNGSLLGIVALLNLTTVITVAVVMFRPAFGPLVTLGDAVRSFLQNSDPTTVGSCLMTKRDVNRGLWGLQRAMYWNPKDVAWFRVPSLARWGVAAIFWAGLVGLGAVVLGMGINSGPVSQLSAFGTPSGYAVYILYGVTSVPGASLITSIPHMLLGGLYFATNSVLTTYYLSHESAQYALGIPRPLRVSSDQEGRQTTSLYLTLPRPWSWFLVIIFAAMGFVLSQSIFLVAVHLDGTGTNGSSSLVPNVLGLGYSSAGLLILLGLLGILAAAVVLPGFRHSRPTIAIDGRPIGNPLVLAGGSCSAVIAARCHRGPGEPADMACRDLVWGTVQNPRDGQSYGGSIPEAGHCSYTAFGHAGQMDLSWGYA